eukprot:TRINITY_DN693_c0_g1_i10.p1 TRINITY_DN693_c0_g1~~TRINITY_DN693_c0_g1_i10.p1  ORF type:complete len:377 (+),score=101.42 TRINITY_DN693_c0_g1_i10:70-1131(+)
MKRGYYSAFVSKDGDPAHLQEVLVVEDEEFENNLIVVSEEADLQASSQRSDINNNQQTENSIANNPNNERIPPLHYPLHTTEGKVDDKGKESAPPSQPPSHKTSSEHSGINNNQQTESSSVNNASNGNAPPLLHTTEGKVDSSIENGNVNGTESAASSRSPSRIIDVDAINNDRPTEKEPTFITIEDQDTPTQNNNNGSSSQADDYPFRGFRPTLFENLSRHLLNIPDYNILSCEKRTGIWGECLVYELLKKEFSDSQVVWVNQERESFSPYDVMVIQPHKPTIYCEVKSTFSHFKGVFEMSVQQILFANEQGENFWLFRVYNAQDFNTTRVDQYPNLIRQLKEKRINLKVCL